VVPGLVEFSPFAIRSGPLFPKKENQMHAMAISSINAIISVISFNAGLFRKLARNNEGTEKEIEFLTAVLAIENLVGYLKEKIVDFSPDDIITVNLHDHEDAIVLSAKQIYKDLEKIRQDIPADRPDLIEELQKLMNESTHVLEILKS
jgi:hypothetical protein